MTIDEMKKDAGIELGLTLSEQVSTVETALRTIGLTSNLARLVLVCGHGSSSDNNPFEAELHCGACGGHPGKANARVFASIANKPEVRSQLANNGIAIPEDTHFIAGLHDTTTDAVVIFDPEDIPPSHQEDIARLTKGLRDAAVRTNQERGARLPLVKKGATPSAIARDIDRRAGEEHQPRLLLDTSRGLETHQPVLALADVVAVLEGAIEK